MQDTLRNGTTVIFVSHNMDAVLSLCNRALLLNHGKVLAEGRTVDVIDEYYRGGAGYFVELRPDVFAKATAFSSTHDETNVVDAGEHATYTHTVVADRACEISPGLQIRRENRAVVRSSYARMRGEPLRLAKGESTTVDWSLFYNFPGGAYTVSYFIEDAKGGYHDFMNGARIVIVGDDPKVKSECYVGMSLVQESERTLAGGGTLKLIGRR